MAPNVGLTSLTYVSWLSPHITAKYICSLEMKYQWKLTQNKATIKWRPTWVVHNYFQRLFLFYKIKISPKILTIVLYCITLYTVSLAYSFKSDVRNMKCMQFLWGFCGFISSGLLFFFCLHCHRAGSASCICILYSR